MGWLAGWHHRFKARGMRPSVVCESDKVTLQRHTGDGNLALSPSQFSSADSASPWTAARQASLSITNSRSLLKLMSNESVIPSNHLTLCGPLLLLPSIFPSIRIFSNELVLLIRWPDGLILIFKNLMILLRVWYIYSLSEVNHSVQ